MRRKKTRRSADDLTTLDNLLEQEGKLTCPVIAVNESSTELTFNDRYGTGQSALDGILRATNLLLAGQTLVVLGYGATGRGIALRARGAGATVIVCEIDPTHIAALEALDRLYEATERWGELASVLERKSEVASSPDVPLSGSTPSSKRS